MSEIISVSDSTLNSILEGDRPILLLFTNGSDLRGDFSAAFKNAAQQNSRIVFAKIDPQTNPEAVAQFDVGSRCVLLGIYNGEVIVRRSRPWGTDVPLAIERLEQAVVASAPATSDDQQADVNHTSKEHRVDNKPVAVTDDTFQEEVINYSDNMPVLVDFWAEWCGPCRMVAPILEKLADEYAGKVRVAKVDVDANPGLAQYFRVMSIPTIMVLKNRTQIFSQPGAFPEAAFRDLIDQAIALEVPAPETEESAETETENSAK